ncbi:MAG: hypothetical protein QM820_20480 [Minicystis sp.]
MALASSSRRVERTTSSSGAPHPSAGFDRRLWAAMSDADIDRRAQELCEWLKQNGARIWVHVVAKLCRDGLSEEDAGAVLRRGLQMGILRRYGPSVIAPVDRPRRSS